MAIKSLQEQYKEEIVPALMKDFGYKSLMQVPSLKKIVVNVGLGEALDNAKAIDFALNDIQLITGQNPWLPRRGSQLRPLSCAKVGLSGSR